MSYRARTFGNLEAMIAEDRRSSIGEPNHRDSIGSSSPLLSDDTSLRSASAPQFPLCHEESIVCLLNPINRALHLHARASRIALNGAL
jgi:hypothetical protein